MTQPILVADPPAEPVFVDVADLSVAAYEFVRRELQARGWMAHWVENQVVIPDPPPTVPELSAVASEELVQALFRSTSYRIIHGKDDRIDAYRVMKEPQQSWLMAVAAVMYTGGLERHPNGTISWDFNPYGRQLCADVNFRGQPDLVSLYGTAFLVAPDLVLTAGHLLTQTLLPKRCFMFGYHMLDKIKARTRVPDDWVSWPQKIEKRVSHGNEDWCLVRLRDPVPAQRRLPPIQRTPLTDDTRLYTLGHSHRLPLKLAGNGYVLDNTASTHFETDLDILDHSSGSPVFNADTHHVVGLVKSGKVIDELVKRDGCWRFAPCPCGSEKIVRISLIGDLIP